MNIEQVINRTKTLESTLVQHYAATGRGMHAKITSASEHLSSSVIRRLRTVATIRNRLLHEDTFTVLNVPKDFSALCDELEQALNGSSERLPDLPIKDFRASDFDPRREDLNELTKAEFFRVLTRPMKNVSGYETDDPELSDIVDVGPYINSLEDKISDYSFKDGEIGATYRTIDEKFDHVLLEYSYGCVLVLVIERLAHRVYGHFILDIYSEYWESGIHQSA
jgi:hypothetical protein